MIDKANKIARKGSLLHNVSAEVKEAYKQGYEDGCYAISWMSVSEGLPEDEGRYLVCIFNNETNTLEGYGVEPYYQDMNEKFIWGVETIKGQPFRVVAWMPIPTYEGE